LAVGGARTPVGPFGLLHESVESVVRVELEVPGLVEQRSGVARRVLEDQIGARPGSRPNASLGLLVELVARLCGGP
jgi:hypothetical protein